MQTLMLVNLTDSSLTHSDIPCWFINIQKCASFLYIVTAPKGATDCDTQDFYFNNVTCVVKKKKKIKTVLKG